MRLRLAHRSAATVARPGGAASVRERGAVLVEFAFVAVLLIVILAGTFDYGMAWRTGLVVNESARAGARVGSSQGKSENADFSLLSSTRASLDSGGVLAEVDRVVIYRSATANGSVPSACKTGAGAGCNILTGDQLRALPANVAGAIDPNGCITLSTTKNFCPTTRNNIQLNADYVGVWVRMVYSYTFGILGSTTTIERNAVMRIEPSETGS